MKKLITLFVILAGMCYGQYSGGKVVVTNGVTVTQADLRYLYPSAKFIAWNRTNGAIQNVWSTPDVNGNYYLMATNAIIWQMVPVSVTNTIVVGGMNVDFDGNDLLIDNYRQDFSGALSGFFSAYTFTNLNIRNVQLSARTGAGWNATTETNEKPYTMEFRYGSNYTLRASTFQIENDATVATNVLDFVKSFVDVTCYGKKTVVDVDFICMDTNTTTGRTLTLGATHGGAGIPLVYFDNCRFVTTTNMIAMWTGTNGASYNDCYVNYYAGTNIYNHPNYAKSDRFFKGMSAGSAQARVIDNKQNYTVWQGANRTNQPQNNPTATEINDMSIGWRQTPLPASGIGSASVTATAPTGAFAFYTIPTNSNSGFLCPMVEEKPANGTMTIASTMSFPAGNAGSNAIYSITHFVIGSGSTNGYPAVQPTLFQSTVLVTNATSTNQVIIFTNTITGITNNIFGFRIQRGVTPTADSGVTNVTLPYFGSRYKVN